LKPEPKYHLLLLILVLTYPVFYQSAHIIWHGHQKQEICCSAELNAKSCENEQEGDQKLEDKCPVCEYEIIINSFAPESIQYFSSNCSSFRYDFVFLDKIITNLNYKKSPRAPPPYTV
jgi:hypothetical protein